MLRLLSVLMIVLCSVVFLFGQGTGKKAIVDGQIRYKINGNKLSLEALCENQSNKSLTLTYKLKVNQSDSHKNTVSNSQGGKKELAALESKSLSSTAISWHKGSSVTAVLDIYHRNKLLDSDTLELSTQSEESPSEK